MHILTIDGSFFAQRILHANGFTFKENPEKDKKDFIRKLIQSICTEVKSCSNLDHVIFCKDHRSWRKDFKQVYPLTTKKNEDKQGYKKNREDDEKNYDFDKYLEAYEAFVKIIQSKYGIQIIHVYGAEADDACAIVSKKLTSVPGVVVTIWSSDGDYYQMVNDKISLIKLPQKVLCRPTIVKTEKVDMFSVFGKKVPNSEFQPILESFAGNIMNVNPAYSIFAKCVMGDGKDNVPCMWQWLSTTGSQTRSINKTHMTKTLEALELTRESFVEDMMYNEKLMKQFIFELFFITKQHTRIDGYDKKVHKIDEVKKMIDDNELSDYISFCKNFINHSFEVFQSNRKMKVLNEKEIPEKVINDIYEDLQKQTTTAKMEFLNDVITALQMVHLQETSSYFDMFNLKK